MLIALRATPQTLLVATALAVVTIFLRRNLALPLILIIVGASLILIRESGEQVIIENRSIPFEVIARGDSDPLPIRVFGSERQSRSCSLRGESRLLGNEAREIPLRIISDECSIFFGERLAGSGRLRSSDERRVAATLVIDRIESRSAPALWRSLDGIRKGFRALFESRGDAGALVPGMVIGDTALQSDEFDAVMRTAGLSHLTAVSGANFSIVATLIMWLLSLRITDRRVRIVVTVGALLLFTILVRPSPSVLRAGVMAGVVLYAQLRGNQRSSLLALAGAVTVLLLLDPHQGGDAGFALSVLATFAIIVISPRVSSSLMTRLRFPAILAEIISIPIAATLLCTPIVIAISGKLTFASIPLNVFAAPLVPVVTILGFAALVISPLSLPVADLLAWLAHLAAWPIAQVSTLAYQMPIIEMPFGLLGGVIALMLLLGLFILWRRGGTRRSVLIAILLLLVATRADLLAPRWQLYQCDVGQGDALLLRTGASSAVAIDLGPDPSAIDRCLRQAGIDDLTLLVVTHLHADHFGGIDGVLRGRKVARWWLPDRGLISGESAVTIGELEEKLGSKAELVSEGMEFAIGRMKIEVLWPRRTLNSAPRLAGDGSEENNRSIALLISIDGLEIFAGGDIEPAAQEAIAQRHDLTGVDIYKVSHHGSPFRSAQFDAELNPALALVSVGSNNPYGHPSSDALAALAPARIHRTDLDGPARITWWPLRIQ